MKLLCSQIQYILTQRANATAGCYLSCARSVYNLAEVHLKIKCLVFQASDGTSVLLQVANCHESIASTEAVRMLKNEMHSYTRKRIFVNFKRLKFMGHPNASEQKCVIRLMFG